MIYIKKKKIEESKFIRESYSDVWEYCTAKRNSYIVLVEINIEKIIIIKREAHYGVPSSGFKTECKVLI